MVKRSPRSGRSVLVGLLVAGIPCRQRRPRRPPGTRALEATWAPPVFAPYGRLLDGKAGMRPSSVDRVVRGSWWGGPSVASTGETVTVFLSDAFPQDESTRATWVNFFAWLHHGSELPSLTVYVALLSEVQSFCGPEAGGCYSPARKILVIPGDLDPGVDFDIAAHEYGHHIAANRRNDPWDPNGYGPKRWATYASVCARAAAGTAFPGDEGAHYRLNTGEAFAEAYRALEESRGVYPWAHLPLVVDASFTPDAGAQAAALADVQQPWTAPRRRPGRSLHRPGGRPQRERRPDADAEDGRGLAGQDPRAGAVRAGRPRPLQAGQFPPQRAGSRPEDGRARREAGSAGRSP